MAKIPSSRPPLPGFRNEDSSPAFWTPESGKSSAAASGSQKRSVYDTPDIPPVFKTESESNAVKSHRSSSFPGGFRPGGVMLGLAAVLLGGSLLMMVSYSSASYDSLLSTDVSSDYASAASYAEAGDPVLFQTKEGTVITVPVSKTDPDMRLDGLSGIITVTTDDYENDEYAIYFPSMDYFTDTVYASTILYGTDKDDIQDIDIRLDSGYSQDIQDYAWMYTDNSGGADADTIRKLMLADPGYAHYDIQITNDGVAEQDGVVIAKGSYPKIITDAGLESDDEHVYGSYNVIFKKDGNVVFADEADYSTNFNDAGTFPVLYSAPYRLPDYDSVEIVDLH